MKTAEQYLSEIPEPVRPRLLRAIRDLLNAGRDTKNVAETLKPQASFGKYDGCHPMAIESIAIQVCDELNREIREQNAEIARTAVASLRSDFPQFVR